MAFGWIRQQGAEVYRPILPSASNAVFRFGLFRLWDSTVLRSSSGLVICQNSRSLTPVRANNARPGSG